jgi:RNA polymerase sigma-70 factor (sigma-E family)
VDSERRKRSDRGSRREGEVTVQGSPATFRWFERSDIVRSSVWKDDMAEIRVMAQPIVDEGGAKSRRWRSLEVLFVQHSVRARRLAYALTGDPNQADDLVQEAFVRVMSNLPHLRSPDRLDSYLQRTIVNLFTSGLRRRRVERAWLGQQRPQVEAPTQDPTDRADMWRLLHGIPERQRAALVLRFYEDLSERQTAEVMGCTERAANSLVVRGLRAMRDQLEGGAWTS